MARKGEKPSLRYTESKRYRAEAKALGANLRALREERQWTLEATEQETGIDWKHIQKIEAARLGVAQLNVTLVTLCRLCDGFDVPMQRLFATKTSVRRK